MATLEQLRIILSGDEIDYPAVATAVGNEALPLLLALTQENDPAIAPRAVYLASLLQPEGGVEPSEVVRTAMNSGDELVRLAAAGALANLPDVPPDLVALLADPDAGVRKLALKSTVANPFPGAREAVLAMVEGDPEPFVRELASNVIDRIA
jgi:HEAT repeat protein